MKKDGRVKRVVALFVEPTSYVIALAEEIDRQGLVEFEAYYIHGQRSQRWDISNISKRRIIGDNLLGAVKFLWNEVRREKVDCIHLAGWGEPMLLAMILWGRMRSIDITIESDSHESSVKNRFVDSIRVRLYRILFRIPKIYFPGGCKQAEYLKRLGVSPDKIQVSKMTVDVNGIKKASGEISKKEVSRLRQGLEIMPDDIVFLHVGRHEKEKNIAYLISTFKGLVAAGRKGIWLLLVGEGSLTEKLKKQARTEPNIKFTGRLEGRDLLKSYMAADVLVLPSTFEPWGLVVNEAMATGKAVIVSDKVGCADDLVKGRGTGFVIRNDTNELGARMLEMARDANMRSFMSRRARDVIANWGVEDEALILGEGWLSI